TGLPRLQPVEDVHRRVRHPEVVELRADGQIHRRVVAAVLDEFEARVDQLHRASGALPLGAEADLSVTVGHDSVRVHLVVARFRDAGETESTQLLRGDRGFTAGPVRV